VKQIIFSTIVGLVVAGCCSTQNDIQRLSTSDLQLRRYELKHCLRMARTSWDKQVWQSNTYNDVRDDLEEKEAIEREITRRGVRIITGHLRAHIDTYMIVVTASVGLLPSEILKKSPYHRIRSFF